MPKLKKKKTEVEVSEAETTEVVDNTSTEVQEEVNANINDDEVAAISKQEEVEADNTVHTDKLNKALKVVHDKFNLDGYSVMSFKDAGNKVNVSVSNGEFDLTICVRDCEAYGIF